MRISQKQPQTFQNGPFIERILYASKSARCALPEKAVLTMLARIEVAEPAEFRLTSVAENKKIGLCWIKNIARRSLNLCDQSNASKTLWTNPKNFTTCQNRSRSEEWHAVEICDSTQPGRCERAQTTVQMEDCTPKVGIQQRLASFLNQKSWTSTFKLSDVFQNFQLTFGYFQSSTFRLSDIIPELKVCEVTKVALNEFQTIINLDDRLKLLGIVPGFRIPGRENKNNDKRSEKIF